MTQPSNNTGGSIFGHCLIDIAQFDQGVRQQKMGLVGIWIELKSVLQIVACRIIEDGIVFAFGQRDQKG